LCVGSQSTLSILVRDVCRVSEYPMYFTAWCVGYQNILCILFRDVCRVSAHSMYFTAWQV